MVIANIGTPQNARSAIVSPNAGPHTGFLRLAFSDPEQRKLSQARARRRRRAHILTREFPGRGVAAVPGRPRGQRVRQRLHRAAGRRGARRQPRRARRAGQGRRRGGADASPGVRDVRSSLQIDYPEIRVDTDREKAGLVGVTSRERRADHARGDARQHQHAQRLDRPRQRPVVLRRHLLRRRAGRPTPAPWRSCRCASATPGRPVTLGAYGDDPARRSGRSPSSATTSSARRTSSCRPRGATSAASPTISRRALRRPTRARATSRSTSSARSQLMRDDLLGPRAWRWGSR